MKCLTKKKNKSFDPQLSLPTFVKNIRRKGKFLSWITEKVCARENLFEDFKSPKFSTAELQLKK